LKLRAFPLLADENLHGEVVAWLRQQGFDVLTVHEANLAGADDQAVLQLAFSQQRVVVTQDSDFGALAVVGQEPFLGIVYLRPGHILPDFTIGTLRTLLSQDPEREMCGLCEPLTRDGRGCSRRRRSLFLLRFRRRRFEDGFGLAA
jgi:predicted nuclease of predicted toxin-antitoxin system